jgi:4-hydroxyphenylacetate 3-monooxygenase
MMTVRFRAIGSDSELMLNAPRLIIAGYTSRDAAAVAAHIEELAAIGIPPPASVPAFFELDPSLVTSAPVVTIFGSNTSGEAEPVLIRHNGRHYLGVGSDHTDRDLERADIAASKAACTKPVGHRIIALPDDLAALSWDVIEVESDVDGQPYQRGVLASLRTPTDLLSRLTSTLGELADDLVIFCGTVLLLTGAFRAGRLWRVALKVDPNTSLTHSYEVLPHHG